MQELDGVLKFDTQEVDIEGDSIRCINQLELPKKVSSRRKPIEATGLDHTYISIGTLDPSKFPPPEHLQGYRLVVQEQGVLITSKSEQGLFYGCTTWNQIVRQADNTISTLDISDWPYLEYRGIMLDISRGRVFSLDYLKNMVTRLATMKINVLQLYIEHTYQFEGKETIWKGSGAMGREDLQELQSWCSDHFIELQPNLQSFGHCNRILTTSEHRHLRESDLYWTLSPALEETYDFLASVYDGFLPIFESTLLNIDSDETYDLGRGKSKELQSEMGTGRLYLQHLMKVRELAQAHGKRIMVFGDVIVKHPELISQLPDDIVYLDWIYDPKSHYDTTELFGKSGKTFWVCPGTGSWNSLFPRQHGSVKNILTLVGQGIESGAQGMLLCDWADHGGYAMPAPSEYSYALGAAASWSKQVPSLSEFEKAFMILMEETHLPQIHSLLSSIYSLPGLWSKNRSQCVIALFDEPLMGRTITGPVPPADLVPLQDLPPKVSGVLDEESHHLMRPVFQLEESTIRSIGEIIEKVEPLVRSLVDETRRRQYQWITEAFRTMVEKVRLGRKIRGRFLDHEIDTDWLLDVEGELRLLSQRFTLLQINFIHVWYSYATTSEIDITLTYFAHGLERLDYLRRWVAKQRIAMQEHREPDYALATYETAGYRSLPTY
jgi:hypothetical protein